jgi:hypothetical protein
MTDTADVVKELDPLFAVADDEETLLKWLKDSVQFRSSHDAELFRTMKNNLSAYMGRYHKRGGYQSDSLERMPMPRTTKYFVNYMYEFTENLVSKMTRMKPALDVMPSNGNFEDRNSAKVVDLIIKHLWYINDLDFAIQKIHRHKYIFGEAYFMIAWNKNLGDFSREYQAIKAAGKTGKLPKGADVRIGDVDYTHPLPWNILLERKTDYKKVTNCIVRETLHKKELKFKFPDANMDLLQDSSSLVYDLDSTSEKKMEKFVDLYTLYYRADEHFPQGRKIEFTLKEVLTDSEKTSDKSIGYSHGDFPFVRITDIEAPGILRGRSRYQQALVIQNAHNNLSQAMMKNEFLMGAPKWMVPRGSVKPEQLANGRTVVQYQGAVPPHLVTMSPTSPLTAEFRDKTQMELGQIMQVNEMSRGEPPKGVIAAVAMQYIVEQDNERASSDISKHNQMIIEIVKKSASVAGDYYDADDGRVDRILGEANLYLIPYFEKANLNKDYDIRIAVGSTTPDSKAGKIARVFQAYQYNPGLFDAERWAELMELGDTDQMETLVSSAILSAESEAEDLLAGRPAEEPKEWEDHIMHLRVHYKTVQARSFKENVLPQNRDALIEHIKVTEMLCEEKAAKNPLFAAKLSQLDMYPMFWETTAPPSAEQQTMNAQNGNGSIPAQAAGPMPGEPQPNIQR